MEDNFIYDMKLGTLRKYISVFDLVAVHIYETRRYYTYAKPADIPDEYNDKYVIGLGMSELEFEGEKLPVPELYEDSRINDDMYYAKCIEITVADKTRNEAFAGNEKIELEL